VTGSLRHALFLVWRYVVSSPGRSIVLVLGTTTALFLPVFTYVASVVVGDALMGRAKTSPVLIGHEGNEFDLTMSSLYFRGEVSRPITYGVYRDLLKRDYGRATPLYLRHSASGVPIVGTDPEYFSLRGLEIAEGRSLARLGEVVAGARVAEEFRLEVGDQLRSDITNLYNIAGAYPKILTVVGVLRPTGTPDDEVLIADVKTTWMLDGLFHGHAEVTRDDALNPEAEEGENLEATAAIFIFNELTEANRDRFHMHGKESEAPLSAVLVFPTGQKAHDQLLGDFVLDETRQAVEPEQVIGTILEIVLRVREGLTFYFVAVGVSTALFFGLVLLLSLRLRAREIALMKRIGCSRGMIGTVVGVEVAMLVIAASLLTGLLTSVGLFILKARLGV
jgi:putative ABC transport system permease protein